MKTGVGPHLVEPRRCTFMPQQGLRRHQDERFPDVAMELPAQNMKVVGRRSAVRDLHVVLGCHLQETLEPGGGMLGTLPLVAMRKQANKSGHPQPLALARGDELVEHHLRAVSEVAELCFPQGQRLGLGQRVTVLESEYRLLREHRIDDLEAGLLLAQEIERDVAVLVLLIDQHGMSLREGAALAVLPGEPHRVALQQQRAERKRLAGRPVDALANLDRLVTILQETLDGTMGMEALRNRGDPLADLRSLASGTPVIPRRGSSASRADLISAQRPSSQSALLGL